MARQDDFAGSDIDMRIDRSLGEMLRRWDANGSVKAAGGRVVTPYFPLPNRLRRVDMRFTTNEIELKNTQIRSGVSSLELTGRIGNLRRALSGRGVLEVDMEIESDTLNFNELARAAMAVRLTAKSPNNTGNRWPRPRAASACSSSSRKAAGWLMPIRPVVR